MLLLPARLALLGFFRDCGGGLPLLDLLLRSIRITLRTHREFTIHHDPIEYPRLLVWTAGVESLFWG